MTTELANQLIQASGTSRKQLSERLMITPSALTQRLKRDMLADTWLSMILACGYEVEIKNKQGEVVWKGEFG